VPLGDHAFAYAPIDVAASANGASRKCCPGYAVGRAGRRRPNWRHLDPDQGNGAPGGGQTQSAYGEAVDQAREASAAVGRGVEQQPAVALLIAGVIGYILGWLTFPRSS
jgi:hypothetical protein